MSGSRLWGALGVAVALLGVVIIAPETLTGIVEHGVTSPEVLYGFGVVLAAVVTVLIVLPSMVRG
ncbi:hypothetical protein ACFO0N_12185 [Halobium salinum]|uniref:Major facilitator superfamily (MFS) profile domain-containing protein n=1 Tax=Halobium salinum TaxID=1364940 RepID=A0ABD5PCW0_9EURY|nr:hypothetical protein [Halobium salinum]